MILSIVKYGILDLTFVCDGIGWDQKDAAGMAVLKECGFVFHLDQLPEDTRRAMAYEEDLPVSPNFKTTSTRTKH